MAKLSTNGAGLLVFIFSFFGFEVAESQMVELITAVGIIISFALMIRNQWKRGDVSNFLFKR